MQRQIGSNMMVSVAYAGTYSDDMRVNRRLDRASRGILECVINSERRNCYEHESECYRIRTLSVISTGLQTSTLSRIRRLLARLLHKSNHSEKSAPETVFSDEWPDSELDTRR